MPKYIVVEEHSIPALAEIEGTDAKSALANADPGIAFPQRVAVLELKGKFVVVQTAGDETVEVVTRRQPQGPAGDPPDVPTQRT